MGNKIPARFFITTFSFSWLLWGIAIFLGRGNSQDIVYTSSGIIMPLMLLGGFGPAIGAFISLRSLEGKGAIKNYCKKFLSLKFGRKVWLSIFLVLGLSYFIAWIIPEFFGKERIPSFLPNYYIFPIYLLLMVFFGGGQEEIGWRGYILQFLEKKYGLIVGSLILGIIWSIWHLPLWFIPGTSQTYMNFLAFTLMTIGYSYFFSWLIEVSENRLFSGLVAHGAANGFAAVFPTLIMEKGAIQIRFWLYSIITIIVGIIIVLIRTNKNRKSRYSIS